MSSLRRWLCLTYLGMGALPLIVGGGLLLVSGYGSSVDEAQLEMQEVAVNLATRIRSEYRHREELLRASVVANETILGELERIHAHRQSNPTIRAEIQLHNQEWFKAYQAAGRTPLMEECSSGPGAAALQKLLSLSGRLFEELLVTDAWGAVAFLTHGTPIYDHHGQGWWDSANRRGSYLGPRENLEGKATRVLAIRIKNTSGQNLGVVHAVLNLEFVKDMVEVPRRDVALDPDLTVFDDMGRPYASSMQALPPERLISDKLSMTQLMRGGEGTKVFKDGLFLGGSPEIMGFSTGGGVAQKNSVDCPGLVIVEATAAGRATQIMSWQITVGLLALLGGVILCASHFASRVSTPLEELTAGTKEISMGQLETQLDPGLDAREDEIGELAKSFRRMATSLKYSMSELSDEGWIKF